MKVKARVTMTLNETATVIVEIDQDRFDDTANSLQGWDRYNEKDRLEIIETAVEDIVREESGNPWGELDIYNGITHSFNLDTIIEEVEND